MDLSFLGQGLGAIGDGIRQAKQQKLEQENQQLDRLARLYDLNQQRRQSTEQQYMNRQQQILRGAQATDDDLKLEHDYRSSRQYSDRLIDEMSGLIGGKEGKGQVKGWWKKVQSVMGIEDRPELPTLGGNPSQAAQGGGKPGPDMPMPKHGGASDFEWPLPPGSGQEPQPMQPQSQFPDTQASSPAQASAGPAMAPRPQSSGTEQFQWQRYQSPKNLAQIQTETNQRANSLTPPDMVNSATVERAQKHAQELMELVGHYVNHVQSTVSPDDNTYAAAVKDPNFVKLINAIESLQYAPPIQAGGKMHNVIDPGYVQSTLKRWFPDYMTHEEQRQQSASQGLDANIVPIYQRLAQVGGREEALSSEDRNALQVYRTFQKEKGSQGSTSPFTQAFNYFQSKGLNAAQAFGAALRQAPGSAVVTVNPITGQEQFEVPNKGSKPEGDPKRTSLNISPFMKKGTYMDPKVRKNPGLAGKDYLDVNRLITFDRANNRLSIDELKELKKSAVDAEDSEKIDRYIDDKLMGAASRLVK